MKRSLSLTLFLLGLSVTCLVAAFQQAPGYMDAEYYYAGGVRLAQGYGFSEQILWNFLDAPTGLPHPSHGYWMPLASVLAWLGMLVGGINFNAGRIPFILLAASLPPLTANLSFALGGRKDGALLAGLLAVFPAFYLPFDATTDTFGLCMVLGLVFFRVVIGLKKGRIDDRGQRQRGGPVAERIAILILGGLAGLMHLARADGFLWLLIAVVAVWPDSKSASLEEEVDSQSVSREIISGKEQSLQMERLSGLAGRALLVLAGYLLIMGPWLLRNLIVSGSLLSPGGEHALWFTRYDDLYLYPASLLTPGRWWQTGLGAILGARLHALGQNLTSALVVQGEIFLAPLTLFGFWRLRRERSIRLGALSWGLILIVMTLIFPFAGERGGFFHSGATLQPLFWATAPFGLEGILEWGQSQRGWRLFQARPIFQTSVVVLAALLSLFLVRSRVIGPSLAQPTWGSGQARYAEVEQALRGWGASPQKPLMVNDAPAYYLASGRPAISIPQGNLNTVLTAAREYSARYLVLEIDQVEGESNWYEQPGDRPGFHYLGTEGEARIYQIDGGG